jgi:DNA-binding response OmpR family regulator
MILVVDDEGIVLSSCQRVLEDAGLKTRVVASGEEAISAAEKREPTLFLIDIKMPKMDGMELIRRLKIKWPRIPIVVMSGYDTRETVAEADQLGADRFIPKPFTPDELLKSIRQALRKEEYHG